MRTTSIGLTNIRRNSTLVNHNSRDHFNLNRLKGINHGTTTKSGNTKTRSNRVNVSRLRYLRDRQSMRVAVTFTRYPTRRSSVSQKRTLISMVNGNGINHSSNSAITLVRRPSRLRHHNTQISRRHITIVSRLSNTLHSNLLNNSISVSTTVLHKGN